MKEIGDPWFCSGLSPIRGSGDQGHIRGGDAMGVQRRT